jgi:acyl CoA:acetate/3-ketoacid CoA transferase alpha subunit
MSRVTKKKKLMTLREAVQKFIFDGATIGLGGQNIARCQIATVHEIIRQGKRGLTLTGCNLSIQMDMLVAAGVVKRCECGGAGLERFGATYSFKRAIEGKRMEIEDYSHGSMVSRFLAGEMGLPFIPCYSLLGSDILKTTPLSMNKKWEIIDNPWNPDEKVLLLPAMVPDVALVHVQKADETGNVLIEGILSHEPELIRASKTCIVTCEEIISSDEVRRNPDRTTIPYFFIDAVVEVPFGAHPTATYGYYTYDSDHIRFYQDCARKGGDVIKKYLDDFIYSSATFEDYLEKVGGMTRMVELRKIMLQRMQ